MPNTDDCLQNETSGRISDILLACLALSRCNQDEDMEKSTLEQISCITSSLMYHPSKENAFSDENEDAILNPLNPWHTLQANPVEKIATRFELPLHDDNNGETIHNSLLSYTSSIPSFFDTAVSKIYL